MKVSFTIDGDPKAKERPRMSTRTGKVYTPDQTIMYENWIKLMYNITVKHYFRGNVRLIVTCYYDITKKDREAISKQNLKTKSYREAIGKLDGSIRPNKKPDIDNIIKAIADSLNGIAYKDDAQVVEVIAKKFYSDMPRVEVIIEDIA